MKDIISVCSGKGGVGKSTISALIALSLSKKFKTLVIDADLGLTNLDLIFKVNNTRYDLTDVINKKCNLKDAILSINDSLDLLTLYHESSLDSLNTIAMKKVIASVCEEYDYLILDCPAGIEKGFNLCLSISNKAIIVINPIATSVRDSYFVSELIEKNYYQTIGYILNRASEKNLKKVMNVFPRIASSLLFRLSDNKAISRSNFSSSLMDLVLKRIGEDENDEIHI